MVRPFRLSLLALGLIVSLGTQAEIFTGRVVGVVDGDTVDVLTSSNEKVRIRIAGIDAPEKAQPYGQRAKQKMSALVMGKDVRVDSSKKDRFGRTVAIVFASGQDAGLSLIRSGLAWHYKKYQREQSVDDRRSYADAEDMARSERIGLWGDANPVAPWEWRHR